MALEAKLNGLVPQLEQGQGNLGRKTVRTLLALSGVACHLCGMRMPESPPRRARGAVRHLW